MIHLTNIYKHIWVECYTCAYILVSFLISILPYITRVVWTFGRRGTEDDIGELMGYVRSFQWWFNPHFNQLIMVISSYSLPRDSTISVLLLIIITFHLKISSKLINSDRFVIHQNKRKQNHNTILTKKYNKKNTQVLFSQGRSAK